MRVTRIRSERGTQIHPEARRLEQCLSGFEKVDQLRARQGVEDLAPLCAAYNQATFAEAAHVLRSCGLRDTQLRNQITDSSFTLLKAHHNLKSLRICQGMEQGDGSGSTSH